jgi:hypothetical protein
MLALAQWLSSAGIGFDALLASLSGSGMLIAILLVAAARARRGSPRNAALTAVALLVLAQAAVAVLFIGAQTPRNPLFRARFALSEDALARAHDPTGRSESAQWIGLFRIDSIETFADETRLTTGACGVVDRCGFARRATAPATRGKLRYRHVDGDWYLLYEVF